MLEFAWSKHGFFGFLLNFICRPFYALVGMTLDEKIRFGMFALTGAAVVLATLGVHVNPLDIIGGSGSA